MKNLSYYLITSPSFSRTDYNIIFQVNPNRTLKRIEYQPEVELGPKNYKKVTMPFPREIVYLIIDKLILMYIKGMNFEMAQQLVFIDFPTMNRFYAQWFDPDIWIRHTTKWFRISNTFELLQKVVDGVLQFPNEEHDHYMALQLEYTSRFFNNVTTYNPWNFNGCIDIIAIPKPGIFCVEDFRAFVTGPYITDVVWMNGRNENGIVASDYFRLPVIVFVLTEKDDGELIPTREQMMNSQTFKNFARLLKLAFGPTTGIFFAVQGEYIFDDQILVEL
jgi:hypothetical protein